MLSNPNDTLIPVGRLGKPHGLRGQLTLHLHHPDSDRIWKAKELILRDGAGDRTVRVERLERVTKGGIVLLAGCTSREAADTLVHAEVLVPSSFFPPLAEGEGFYAFQLEGLTALSETGEKVGVVATLTSFGAGDILVVDVPGDSWLLPFAEPYVGQVDLVARTVVVRPLEEV
jgi:16S rRNA processing protein RimM